MLGEEKSFWEKVGDALGNTVASAITTAGRVANQQITASVGLEPTIPTVTLPRPAAPKLSYLIPLGIAGVAGAAAIVLTIKKKRRR